MLNIFIKLNFFSAVRSVLKVNTIAGSLNGGTKITIDGTGFATNQYDGGNSVFLTSETEVVECKVQKDGTTEVQILCVTE